MIDENDSVAQSSTRAISNALTRNDQKMCGCMFAFPHPRSDKTRQLSIHISEERRQR